MFSLPASFHRQFLIQRILILACLSLESLALAQQVPTGTANLKFNRIEINIDVDNDLTSRTQAYFEKEALTAEGVLSIGQLSKGYDKYSQTYKVEEAYTLKADGRKLLVTADQIQKQSGIATGNGGQSWPNAEVIQVTFPDVQVGDRTVIRSVESTFKLPLPGFYSYFDYLPANATVDSIKIKMTAPRSVSVHVQGEPSTFAKAEGKDRTTWTLEANQLARSIDDDAIDPYQVWPYFVASTFQTYEQMALAYASQSDSKVKITPDVQKLVDHLIQGHTDTQSGNPPDFH